MRVISGSRKGLRLQAPAGRAVRPTSDRAREALMSALGGGFDGQRVLDLYAGTGAVGIEWLSRGCGSAVFVDSAPSALACLRANLERAHFGGRAEVMACDAMTALERLAERGERFELMYLDPPWRAGLHAPALRRIARGDLLAPGAEVIVEGARPLGEAEAGPPWRSIWRRRYGAAVIERLELVSPGTTRGFGERA